MAGTYPDINHPHGERLLTAGTALLETVVQIKGYTGKIPIVLKQSKKREENSHGREHHAYHPGCDPIYSVDQNLTEDFRNSQHEKAVVKTRFQPEQPLIQQVRGDICPHNGDPENAEQEQEHNGKPRASAGENPVQFPVPSGIIRIFQSDTGPADRRGLLDIGAAVFRGSAAHLRVSAVNVGNRGNGLCVGKGIFNPPEYAFQAFPAPGRYADNRNLQFFLEPQKVYADMLFSGLVHEIYTQEHMGGDSTNLENQIEISFQTGGIADSHHHIRMALQDIITGDLLLTGAAGEGITARQIYKTVFPSPIDPVSCGAFHCFSAPIPCMLMHTGQRVEHSAFTYVGIADQCYITEGNLLFLFFLQNYSPLNS